MKLTSQFGILITRCFGSCTITIISGEVLTTDDGSRTTTEIVIVNFTKDDNNVCLHVKITSCVLPYTIYNVR